MTTAILNDLGTPYHRDASLDEIADAIRASIPDSHSIPASEPDGRRWENEEHTRVRIDCGLCCHYADYDAAYNVWRMGD